MRPKAGLRPKTGLRIELKRTWCAFSFVADCACDKAFGTATIGGGRKSLGLFAHEILHRKRIVDRIEHQIRQPLFVRLGAA